MRILHLQCLIKNNLLLVRYLKKNKRRKKLITAGNVINK